MPVPPIPDFGRVHGPVSRFLLRRSVLVLVAFWSAGLVLDALGSSAGVHALGLGLLLPGGGFLYAGQPVLAAVAFLAFPVALGVWWLCGIVVLPPAVWLAAAGLAAAGVRDSRGVWGWSRWAVPLVLLAFLAAGLGYQQIRFRVQRRRGQAYNQRLVQQQPLRPAMAAAPSPREAGTEDLMTLRYVLDLALQPSESWEGFFFVRPEQFREGAGPRACHGRCVSHG